MLTARSYQEKIIVSMLIFLALVFGLIYLLIVPNFANMKKIKAQIGQQSLEAEKNYTQGQDLKKMAENIKVVEPRLAEIEQIFIKKNDPSSFISSLEESMAKNNITEITAPVLGTETRLGSYYSQIPLQLYVQGSFKGISGFIVDLETQNKYTNINSLQMTVIGLEKGGAKMLSAQISASTYWEN